MKIITTLLFLLTTVFLYQHNIYCQTSICKHIANYKMDVTLIPEKKIVDGKEILTWTNDSLYSTDELYFHLYMNAFKNNKTTFIKEGEARGVEFKKDIKQIELGFCDIISMKMFNKKDNYLKETDITPLIEFVQPDDNNKSDQTVIKVKLPFPIQPQEEIRLEIEFITKLPRTIARSGYYQDYFFVAQWFPKIGVFQDGKWNCHQYHARSEFFADYGIYDVNITVPSKYVVGATGKRRSVTKNPEGTMRYNYYQESVHDFAWTACKDYIEKIENFTLPSGKSVEIILLIMSEHKNQAERYLNATKYAIRYYSQWYGEYPYSTVTVVDPAFRSGAGGMEYPTFFTGGTSWIQAPKGVHRPESVTIHEFGHGYWYGLVGNNEFEHAWLDEGINTFSTAEVLDVAYGPYYHSINFFGFPFVFRDVKYEQRFSGLDNYRRQANNDIMERNAWEYISGTSYVANVYSKAQVMLQTLKNYLGRDIFNKVMMAYSQRWWYKHPKPTDFFNVVNEISGQDLTWFFNQFVYGSDVLDYSIKSISCEPEADSIGIFTKRGIDALKKEMEKKLKEKEKIKPDTTIKVKDEKEKIYINEILVRRLGEAKMPVEVKINFDNGESITEVWDGQYTWKKFVYKKNTKVASAIVDPEHKNVIEINYTNNSKIMKKDYTASLKWTSKWMFWLQHLLEICAFFS